MARKPDFVSRWSNRATMLVEKSLPFGQTDMGLADYRGVPATTLRELKNQHFLEIDFSHGDFDNVWIEDCRFDRCRFDGCSFVDVSEHKSSFRECNFDRVDFTLAHLGYSTSRYEACSFIGTKLSRTGLKNPIFQHCQFAFARAKTIDFGCSGLWNCTVRGALADVMFAGQYWTSQDQETPVMTGLHNVDFRGAALEWISPRWGCAIDGIRLDNQAFVFRCNNVLRDAQETAARFPDPARSVFITWCKLTSIHAKHQEVGILCKRDLASKCGEAAAEPLFEFLKEKYQLGPPYVIA